MIARVRELCVADEGLDAALMYGSFAAGEADEHSDIEFWLFFTPERLVEINPREWCAQVAPVRYGLVNEFGTYVAFFPGLIRGEFHFVTTAEIATVADWPARGAEVDRMLVVDRRGELEPVLRGLPRHAAIDDVIAKYCDPLLNWLVLARNLLARGEVLRAWDALAHIQRHLLWMARLAENSTEHWLTPSRAAERELSASIVDDIRAATARAEPADVSRALRAATDLGRRLWQVLADRAGRPAPTELFDELGRD